MELLWQTIRPEFILLRFLKVTVFFPTIQAMIHSFVSQIPPSFTHARKVTNYL
jgi:hypothetical protein